MATYRYIARNLTGTEVSGVVQGDTRSEILVWLREKTYTPVALEEVAVKAEGRKKGKRRLRIRSSDMASFCWQLNTMIDGGVTITDAIDTIVDDIDNRKLQEVLKDVCEKMKTGQSFYESLQDYPKVFNELFSAMIRAGESSGTLTTVLTRLADYYDRKDELNRKVKKALSYPIFVVGFVILVLVVMMVFIIPTFKQIFDDFGTALPAITQGLMTFYDVTSHNVHYGVGLLAGAVILLSLYNRSAMGHRHFSGLWLRLPVARRIIQYAFVATFGRTMSTLLGAGVPVLNAIEILEGMTKNDLVKDVLARAKTQIAEGVGVALSLTNNRIFPSLMVKMVQVGEESGSLPEVLDRSSVYYEKKVDTTVSMMISLLEPTMIVLVGGIVLVVLLALYLPIFSMSDVKQV
jgi:type IV pilus assembly protein PilC